MLNLGLDSGGMEATAPLDGLSVIDSNRGADGAIPVDTTTPHEGGEDRVNGGPDQTTATTFDGPMVGLDTVGPFDLAAAPEAQPGTLDAPEQDHPPNADTGGVLLDASSPETSTTDVPIQNADSGPACGGGCCTNADCPSCQSCSPSHSCVAVVNADDPVSGRCAGTCDSTGTCKSKKGQTCQTVTTGCATGTTCSPDGVCCDQACTSSCMACDISGFLGTCTSVASGNPHGNRTSCAGSDSTCSGSCAGRSDGQCSYPTKACGAAASCSGTDNVIAQSSCVSGACQTQTAQTCSGGFACSSGACNTTCTTSADCQADYFCSGETCHSDVVSVAPGGFNTCAVLKDGRVMCWGDPGALGDGIVHSTPVGTPVQVANLTSAKLVRAAYDSTCALTTTGGILCWGGGNYGQLGTGTNTPASGQTSYFSKSPVTVVTTNGTALTGMTAIYSGRYASCAISTASASVTPTYCWGDNGWGRLGYATTSGTDVVLSATLLQSTSAYSQFAMGEMFQVASVGATTVYAWGYNRNGNVVPNASIDFYPDIWSQSYSTSSTVSQMVAGYSRACLLLSSGAVQCWGDDSSGALGNGSAGDDPIPGHAIAGFTATHLTSGNNFMCAQTSDVANVKCWGNNSSAVVGADTSVNYSTPTTVNLNLPPGLTVSEVAASTLSLHVCVIVSDGSLMCWGDNYSLQTGSGSTASHTLPAFVQANW